MIEFDLDSLHEALMRNPHSIDGDFNSSLISYDSDVLFIEFDNGNRIEIDDIVSEDSDNGFVYIRNKSKNERYTIQFFKPASFDKLNF